MPRRYLQIRQTFQNRAISNAGMPKIWTATAQPIPSAIFLPVEIGCASIPGGGCFDDAGGVNFLNSPGGAATGRQSLVGANEAWQFQHCGLDCEASFAEQFGHYGMVDHMRPPRATSTKNYAIGNPRTNATMPIPTLAAQAPREAAR